MCIYVCIKAGLHTLHAITHVSMEVAHRHIIRVLRDLALDVERIDRQNGANQRQRQPVIHVEACCQRSCSKDMRRRVKALSRQKANLRSLDTLNTIVIFHTSFVKEYATVMTRVYPIHRSTAKVRLYFGALMKTVRFTVFLGVRTEEDLQ